MTYRLSPQAEDLAQIGERIAHHDPHAAARFLAGIEAKCRLLADNPGLGPARPDIAADARLWVVGRHLMLYRATNDGVEIVRVVHGARDLGQLEL